MFVIEYNEIELDYCNQCGGVWFDQGELELMLKPASSENNNLLLKKETQMPSL